MSNYSSATFPTPLPFQDEAHNALRKRFADGHRCQMLMAPTGSGKCLSRDTPVLLANGLTVEVQDIEVGMQLLGLDGTSRNVLSVISGLDQMYRVIPTKGASFGLEPRAHDARAPDSSRTVGVAASNERGRLSVGAADQGVGPNRWSCDDEAPTTARRPVKVQELLVQHIASGLVQGQVQ